MIDLSARRGFFAEEIQATSNLTLVAVVPCLRCLRSEKVCCCS